MTTSLTLFTHGVPVAGILVAVSVPLLRHVDRGQHEQTAIDLLAELRSAQASFRQSTGGFAPDFQTLHRPCDGAPAPTLQNADEQARSAGYVLQLRLPGGATLVDSRCGTVVSDYLITLAPADATQSAQQAFSARADGEIFLSHDGVPPTEAEMANGLATPLSVRETFVIP